MKNKKWDIWNGSKYVGTIQYNDYYKNFYMVISGYVEDIRFKNSKHLFYLLSKYYCKNVDIPNDILEEIDSIYLVNALMGDYNE